MGVEYQDLNRLNNKIKYVRVARNAYNHKFNDNIVIRYMCGKRSSSAFHAIAIQKWLRESVTIQILPLKINRRQSI